MPARSVVFSGLRKHDGRGFRDLLPGKYLLKEQSNKETYLDDDMMFR